MIYDNRDYKIKKMDELNELLGIIRVKNLIRLPLFSTLLIGHTKFYIVEDMNHYASTFFEPTSFYFHVKINSEKMEMDKMSFNMFEFIVFHELLHNIFSHFTRPLLRIESKKNPMLVNICLDTIVNEYILIYLKGSLKISDSEKKEMINYESFEEIFSVKLDNYFDKTNEISNSEKLIEIAKANSKFIKIERSKGYLLINNSRTGKCFKIQEIDDHIGSYKKIEEILDKMDMSENDFENFQRIGLESIIDNAIKSIGRDASEAEIRLTKMIFYKEPALMTVKLKNIFSKIFGIKSKYSYKRINRHREFFTGIPKKGLIAAEKKHIVIGIDTSGSVSSEELIKMLSSIITLLINREELAVDIIVFSSRPILEEDVSENISTVKEVKKIKLNSTGGTCINYLFDYIEKKYKRVILAVLTDGYISSEKVPQNIDELYFILTADTLNNVKSIYPESHVSKIKGKL